MLVISWISFSVSKKKELKIEISDHQSEILDGFDLLATDTTVIPKVIPKEERVAYKPVKRDFIKVDRWVIDLVMPFLNSKCSPGVSVLYLDLYRMTYGYGNNKVRITDEMIERRLAIPKRTIMAHKKELIKYDLIKYKRGHRTKRGEFIVKRPEQSVYFTDYIQKTASLPSKNVGSKEKDITIYNINKVFIDSETLVFDFYKKAGWKQTSITREIIDNGCKVLNKLYQQGYSKDTIKDLITWSIGYCKEYNKPIYGIGFISYLMPEYQTHKDKKAKQKKHRELEVQKQKERDAALEKEQMILNRFDMLPKHMKSMVMTKAKQGIEDHIRTNKLGKFGEYTEKFLLDGFIVEIMKNDFGETPQ